MFSCFHPSRAHPVQETEEDVKVQIMQRPSRQSAPTNTTARLASLRELMEEEKVDAYIVPSTDAHSSEYLAPCDKRRAFISGFAGSAGTAIITRQTALLFADSRYWVQAGQQLDKNWELFKVGSPDVPDWNGWLKNDCPPGSRIGLDPTLIGAAAAKILESDLLARDNKLVYIERNLIDPVWGDAKPPRSDAPLVIHPIEFAGVSATDKIKRLRAYLSSASSSFYLTSSLADIVWFLNIRGTDIPYNPFVFCYLLVPVSEDDLATLFIDNKKVGESESAYLDSIGVGTASYEGVFDALRNLKNLDSGTKVTADTDVSLALANALPKSIVLSSVRSPIAGWKAIKNEAEIEGFRRSYLRDAGAWCRWAAWLEESIAVKGKEINEWDAAEELTKYRAKLEHFAGLAYGNISATNENAALPHYAPKAEGSRIIDTATPYLNDSGAQYLDGTIDTTRTVHFGKPTAEQKLAYTLVLQGHIAVASAIFPLGRGSTGVQLDTLARAPGWKYGHAYGHGTGHGVGSYGGVHEIYHGLGSSATYLAVPLVVGHTLTDEPGYYEEGNFGIRIESFLAVKEVKIPTAMKGTTWLGFERFTQVPIAKNLVDYKILTPFEKEWLHEHNEECKKAVLPLIKDDKRATKWLRRQ